MTPLRLTTLALVVAATQAACSLWPFSRGPSAPLVDNAKLPEPVRAPADEYQLLWTRGVGEITYECRPKKDVADQFEWVFVAPVATLYDVRKTAVGKYYGGPTWEANDGSKVTGKQLAVAPAQPGNIPLQLVKADAPQGNGTMQGVSHIQRLNTKGGVAPWSPCIAPVAGQRRQVPYEADYVFYGR